MSFDTQSYYYSGQGVVMVGDRGADGKPLGLLPVGNVADLKIAITTTVLEHKESQTGQRAIDLRLTTETKASLSMTLESWNKLNLTLALRADVSRKEGDVVTGESTKGYLGKVMPLANLNVSAVAIKKGATVLTPYTNDSTPYDYKVNALSGSFQLNDGSVALTDKLTTGGVVPSAITVGATTSITVANAATADSYCTFTGFAGADAGLLNGKVLRVVSATPTGVVVELNTTAKTITIGTPLAYFDGYALTVDYTYSAQTVINALTTGTAEKYLRFEGLNTADGNNPVNIDVFKFSVDPLKELSLIGEGVGQIQLEGNVLADSLQTSGSKFFRQTQLR